MTLYSLLVVALWTLLITTQSAVSSTRHSLESNEAKVQNSTLCDVYDELTTTANENVSSTQCDYLTAPSGDRKELEQPIISQQPTTSINETTNTTTNATMNNAQTHQNTTQLQERAIPAKDTTTTPPPTTSNTQASIANISPPKRVRKDRYNYASAECGAKALAANPEARELSAVVLQTRDKYTLIPCSAPRKWIVIELCEDVGVDQIQIGNFEFFSSMFRDFQVLGSSRYPVSHWTLLGNFTAKNSRELQSFDIVYDGPVQWFKYIKIRFLNHYGNEFYCPISEVRVHGLTIVEQISAQLEIDSENVQNLETVVKPTMPDFRQPTAEEPSQPDRMQFTSKPIVDATTTTTSKTATNSKSTTTSHSIVELLQNLLRNKIQEKPSQNTDLDTISFQLTDQLENGLNSEPSATKNDNKGYPTTPIGGDEDGDDDDDNNNEVKSHPNNVIATAKVFQALIGRFKSMEANQSWLVGLLLNVTRYFQEQVDALRADQSVMFDVQSHNINVTVERAYMSMLKAISNIKQLGDRRSEKLESLLLQLKERLIEQETEFARLRLLFFISLLLFIIVASTAVVLGVKVYSTLHASAYARSAKNTKSKTITLLSSSSDSSLAAVRTKLFGGNGSNDASDSVTIRSEGDPVDLTDDEMQEWET